MSRDLIREYLELLRASLTKWRQLLLPELSNIRNAPFHPDVDLLHIEFFDDAICEPYFPFFLYCYRKKDGPQYYGTPMPTCRRVFEVPRDSDFFPGWFHLLAEEQQSIIDRNVWERYGEKTEYAFVEDESNTIHDWFVSCWREADGPSIPISSYLLRVYADQTDEGFDLRKLVSVKWRDVWQ